MRAIPYGLFVNGTTVAYLDSPSFVLFVVPLPFSWSTFYFDTAPISSSSHALVRDSGGGHKEVGPPGSKAPRWSSTTSTSTSDVDATQHDSVLLTPLSRSISTAGLPGSPIFSNCQSGALRYDMEIETGRWATWDGLPLYGIGSAAHRFAILDGPSLHLSFDILDSTVRASPQFQLTVSPSCNSCKLFESYIVIRNLNRGS